MSGTIKAMSFANADEPFGLGLISQRGTYSFVNDKLIHVALKEGKSGAISIPAQEFDYDLAKITPTEMT